MNKLLFALGAVSVAISLHARAEELPADALAGKWSGEWDSRGRPSGSMEMVVDVKGDKVFGQVKSTGSPGCSLDWEKLEGVAEGNKVSAHYNLGGRCGKVDIIYSIDQAGKVMTGSWSSQYPGYGGFRLIKQPPSLATGTAPITVEPKGPRGSSRPADASTGIWTGEWQLSGRRGISGSMEMEVDVKDDQVNGRVKSRCTPAEPLEWAKLAGVRKGEKVYAQYDRGGRCGKVDVIYSIDLEGKIMTGTFSNEYPASGTFRLTR